MVVAAVGKMLDSLAPIGATQREQARIDLLLGLNVALEVLVYPDIKWL